MSNNYIINELISFGIFLITYIYIFSKNFSRQLNIAIMINLIDDFSKLLPANYASYLKLRLFTGNYRQNNDYERLLFIKLLGCILIFLFLALNIISFMVSISFFFLPDILLNQHIKRRQTLIKLELPKKIDLLLLCVDAGLSLDSSLSKIIPENLKYLTPLDEELTYLTKDLLFGLNKEIAYSEFYKRTQVTEIASLTSALMQSNRLGISVAIILRNQSDYLVNKTAKLLEAKAQKLPILMAFPLWFFIMPALLIIVLGPSLMLFFDQIRIIKGN